MWSPPAAVTIQPGFVGAVAGPGRRDRRARAKVGTGKTVFGFSRSRRSGEKGRSVGQPAQRWTPTSHGARSAKTRSMKSARELKIAIEILDCVPQMSDMASDADHRPRERQARESTSAGSRTRRLFGRA